MGSMQEWWTFWTAAGAEPLSEHYLAREYLYAVKIP